MGQRDFFGLFYTMQSKRKFLFLVLILLIPVMIFLFLKGLGTNKFDIPVYYTNGVPQDQRFNCDYPDGPYSIEWPAGFSVRTPAALFMASGEYDQNMLRRIGRNHETGVHIYLLDTSEVSIDGVSVVKTDLIQITDLLHCTFASDTTNQWVLVDDARRIRGYYNTSLEEQDRLLDEMSILMSN